MRIISLVPSHTEILFALGLGQQIAGVTVHCDYPAQALSKPRMGTFADPDVAGIISTQPDLVLAGGTIHKSCTEELRRAGLRVFVFEPQTVGELFIGMEKLVQHTQAGKAGIQALDNLKSELQQIKEKALKHPRPKVVFVMGNRKLMTPGPASCQYNALQLAGASLMPFVEEISYVPIAWSDVSSYDPDIILSCGRSPEEPPRKRCPGCNLAFRPCDRDAASIMENPLLAQVPAVKARRVHTIPCHFLCRTGPRLLKGMKKLVALFNAD
ncbi:ABC transporter substrate-binding protein [Desulfoscipio gibsoniae]